jgi:RNA polymerase sigma factor (sigma-70 family)
MASVAPEFPVPARDQAFEGLYRRYVKDVYHYALALLRNPADAEDVTQTTFMNAYRAYKRGDEILKPQNWLIKIAHNVARTRYARASRRVKEVPLEDHVEQLAVPEPEKPNIEGVLRALGGLPFNQRAALVLRELDGRSYAEIADTLGVSVAAVETLIFRARRSLRVRASALRSLGAVPLPSSLLQLFEGSGAVAGGSAVVGGSGAAFGTAFVSKAAVALVAGALATGLGGDGAGKAPAARETLPFTAAPTARATHAVTPRSAGSAAATRAPSADAGAARGHVTATEPPKSSGLVAPTDVGQPAVGASSGPAPAAGGVSGTMPPAGEALQATVTTVTTAATEPVNDAVETVQTVAAPTPALPLQPPTLPALPLELPPPPKLP